MSNFAATWNYEQRYIDQSAMRSAALLLLAGTGLAVASHSILRLDHHDVPIRGFQLSAWPTTAVHQTLTLPKQQVEPCALACGRPITQGSSDAASVISKQPVVTRRMSAAQGYLSLSATSSAADRTSRLGSAAAGVRIARIGAADKGGGGEATRAEGVAPTISDSVTKSNLEAPAAPPDTIKTILLTSSADLMNDPVFFDPKVADRSPVATSADTQPLGSTAAMRPVDSKLAQSGGSVSNEPVSLAQAGAPATADSSMGRPHQTLDGVEFAVMAQVNGASIGKVPLVIQGADIEHPEYIGEDISVRLDSLITLLGPKMDKQLFDQLSASPAAGTFVTLNDLRSYGIAVSFDRHDRLQLKAI